jgi:hypothetical protein
MSSGALAIKQQPSNLPNVAASQRITGWPAARLLTVRRLNRCA